MKKVKFILAVVMVCLLLPLYAFAGDSGQAKPTGIKIGFTEYYNFIEATPQGEYEGYGVDYLKEISQYTNWKYEYVHYNWDTALQKLEDNEIDLLCNATKSDENKEKYNFSQYPIGIEQFVMYCLPTTDLCFDDFENFEDKSIGVLAKSANSYAFDSYARQNGFSYNKKEFYSDEELKKALYDKKVDAIATVHISPYDDLKLIAKYGSNPIYVIFSKKSEIGGELNRAISIIKADKPQFDGDLYKKHYGKSMSATQPMFTRKEMEFIKKSTNIKLGIWSDRIPLSYIDLDSGQPTGISRALMEEISKISGITFDYVLVPQTTALVDALAAEGVDIICGPPNLDEYFENKNMQVSQSYHSSKLVFVSHGAGVDFDDDLTISTLKTTKSINAYIEKTYPRFKMVYADSIYDSLKMVEDKEADITVCNEYSLSYNLQKPVFSRLIALENNSIDERSVIVGLESMNPLLMSIINKSIAVMDEDNTDKIVVAQVANTSYKRTLEDVLYQYGAVLLIFIIAIVTWSYLITLISLGRKKNAAELKKINDELSLQQKRYETVLAQTNDIIFEWNYQTKEILHSKNFSGYLGRKPDGKNFPHNIETKNNVHPDDYDACVKMYLSYEKGAKSASGEFRLKNNDNHYIWFRSRSTAIVDSDGKIIKVLGMLSDINSEKRKLMAIENQAKKDNLTGVYNRSAAEELIVSYIENDVSGALFIIDVDNFKRINDTYGHQSGDEVLGSVAKELVKLFRSGDVVSRLGGDEFMVFMADVSEDYDIGNKAREMVESIKGIQSGNVEVSVSVGISFYPGDGVDFTALYYKADIALYRAKKNGKNQFDIWKS